MSNNEPDYADNLYFDENKHSEVYISAMDDCKIIAPVPSYDEWQAKLEENAQLKELLKSALSWLPDVSKFRAGRYAQLQNLKRKINEVLNAK